MCEFSMLCVSRISVTCPALSSVWWSSGISFALYLFFIILFFCLSVIGSFSCSMLAPCFDNLTACSLPLIPQCAGIHCMITLLCFNMLYSLHLRLCSPCPASESNADLESVRNTTSSEYLLVLSQLDLLVLGLSLWHRSLCSIFL